MMSSAARSGELTTAIQDFATTKGTYVIQQESVGDYLKMLRLYDPKTRTANWDASLVQASFQRAIFPIHKNPIKRRMFRDLTRGGTLPPIVLYIREGQRVLIVDGLQRTDVLTQALLALLALEKDEELKDFAKEELGAMTEIGQKPLSVDEFLKRPVVLQVWKDLDMDELVRLFMVLNVGQQKVSPRHLLEVMGDQLREMFKNWDLPLLTEREEKEQPRRRRGSATTQDGIVPGLTHFRYEYLIDGLEAYVSRDPQVKTSSLLQKTASPNLALEERITEIGSELCRADFVWVCRDLNEAIQARYKEDPKWRVAIQNSDNFFIPLMAALGDARHNQKARAALEDRKAKLIELIRNSSDADPLVLSRDTSDGLANILAEIRSNIGRKQRAVVYSAWRRYFRIGLEDPTYPIDWRVASLSE